jgi:hypothetical protein
MAALRRPPLIGADLDLTTRSATSLRFLPAGLFFAADAQDDGHGARYTQGQMMRMLIFAGLALVALAAPAAAQQRLKILAPSEDSCAALTAAMDARDTAKVLSLGGWALGFLSGIAQESGKDILRDVTGELILDRLYASCKAQPARPMTLLVEELAESLVARRHD